MADETNLSMECTMIVRAGDEKNFVLEVAGSSSCPVVFTRLGALV